MTLSKARIVLKQVEDDLVFCKELIAGGPFDSIATAVEDFNNLIKKKIDLDSLIRLTKEHTLVEDKSLTEIEQSLYMLEEKVDMLTFLLRRDEIQKREKVALTEQLQTIRKTRNLLERQLESCFEETELLSK
jgi:hypothetical protein